MKKEENKQEMQPAREAPCNAAFFTPIYVPSVGHGCAYKYGQAFDLNGPGKAEWRDSKAAVENAGIIFCSVMQQRLDILLHLFIHSFIHCKGNFSAVFSFLSAV